jgi:regulator of sirC expression with transglutaminase-like and TPR domain
MELPLTRDAQIGTMSSHPFDLLMQLRTEHIQLDCAMLHLARDVYPYLALPSYLARLDAMAEDVAARRPGLSAIQRYEAMREVLVRRYALRGNQDDYYDPNNSYLNRVLDRGLGIPISLSAVWLAVARRLKWPVVGLGLPSHFVIRFDDREHFLLVDPFNDGRTLTIDDCRRILDHHFDGKVPLSPEYLEPVNVRVILARLLNNLRRIYTANRDWARLTDVLRRLANVEPENDRHLCDLAGLLHRRGLVRSAYVHLAVYLQRQPRATDRFLLRQKLAHLESAITSLN